MDQTLEHYRSLIYKTATLVVALVEDEFDDVVQVLSIKVWRAVLAFDAERWTRSTDPARARDAYVFMCLTNQVKDLKSKKRRSKLELSLELVADGDEKSGFKSRDRFEAAHGLSVDADVVYAAVEEVAPLLPNTLTDQEREIVALLTCDFKQTEAATLLGLGKRDMERAMRSIRLKLADWKPSPREPGVVVEFPRAAPLAEAA